MYRLKKTTSVSAVPATPMVVVCWTTTQPLSVQAAVFVPARSNGL